MVQPDHVTTDDMQGLVLGINRALMPEKTKAQRKQEKRERRRAAQEESEWDGRGRHAELSCFCFGRVRMHSWGCRRMWGMPSTRLGCWDAGGLLLLSCICVTSLAHLLQATSPSASAVGLSLLFSATAACMPCAVQHAANCAALGTAGAQCRDEKLICEPAHVHVSSYVPCGSPTPAEHDCLQER